MRKADKHEQLTLQELEESYPAMLAILGAGRCTVERVDGPGWSSAHMIFAPDVERALQKLIKNKLWDAFLVTVKKKPKKRAKR